MFYSKTNRKSGFTRTELGVVLGVLSVFALMLLPAMATPRAKGISYTCLANLRLMIQAWSLYAQDNNGRLVMSLHGGDAYGGASASNPRYSPWAAGWLDWTTQSDNTNVQFLVSNKYSKLAPYLNHKSQPFLCPADVFASRPQQANGWHRRARSISMSIGVGDGNAESGPWNATMYRHLKTEADFLNPAPRQTFVFLDENPDSINDPGFFSPQDASTWTDQPASYHEAGGGFAFADGRALIQRWSASLTAPKTMQPHFISGVTAQVQARDADLLWLNYHSARLSAKTF